ncbi:GNAT family N-acetyltransferase [Symbioplanes lichenis]|uniref:GNAT family N-acetyltransferase n=1 Tax=Symbioplanes lichenis TaxID=1629072 RepID=UPI00273A24AC|nr:GNAT family N-acetyltransferase [Actinoplanes lichenis]
MAIVRAATAADVDAICDVCTRGYRATYPELLTPEYIDRVVAEFYQPARVRTEVGAAPPHWLGYQVAEEDGRVLGAAGGGITAPGTGELFVIYLDPDHLRRGLGTLLLDRVIEQVAAAGATQMWVSVLDGNTKGIPFYRAKGFEAVERRRAFGAREDEEVYSWRMLKPLS